jgi:hypothetical protein
LPSEIRRLTRSVGRGSNPYPGFGKRLVKHAINNFFSKRG